MLDLRPLLPVVSNAAQPVHTAAEGTELHELLSTLGDEPRAVVLVVTAEHALRGAVRVDMLVRMARRAPHLRLEQLPLAQVAHVASHEGERVRELLSSGAYLGVLVAAREGSVLLTPDMVPPLARAG